MSRSCCAITASSRWERTSRPRFTSPIISSKPRRFRWTCWRPAAPSPCPTKQRSRPRRPSTPAPSTHRPRATACGLRCCACWMRAIRTGGAEPMAAHPSMVAPLWREPADPLAATHFAKVRLPLLEAETLPPWAYTSPGFYTREVEAIFGKVWNFIGRADRLSEAGSFFTVDFAGVPLAVVRGKDGKIRAFANTCRHRGARLLAGEGRTRDIRCPYHSWNYSLSGALRIAPEMDQTRGFDTAHFGLTEFRLDSWGGFLFVCFDPDAPPLLETLGDLPALLAPYALDDMVTVRRKEW